MIPPMPKLFKKFPRNLKRLKPFLKNKKSFPDRLDWLPLLSMCIESMFFLMAFLDISQVFDKIW